MMILIPLGPKQPASYLLPRHLKKPLKGQHSSSSSSSSRSGRFSLNVLHIGIGDMRR